MRDIAIVGLGSNVKGSAKSIDDQLVQAAHKIEADGAGRVIARSRMFATPPWGGVEQEDFRNAVIAVEAALPPLEFLHACQAIERAAHRTREVHWGPRTLDVDVLSWFSLEDDATAPQPLSSSGKWGQELILPHPYAHQRAFVLVPWADLPMGQDERWTVVGHSVNYWLSQLQETQPEEVAEVRPVASPDWDVCL